MTTAEVPRGACLVFALLSAAIGRKTDPCPCPNSRAKIKHGRTERKSVANGYTFPTSGLGKRPEHENDGGTVPIHLTLADSDADTAKQHVLDHLSDFIDLSWLECEYKFSHNQSTSDGDGREKGGDACREGGEVYWMVSVRGSHSLRVVRMTLPLSISVITHSRLRKLRMDVSVWDMTCTGVDRGRELDMRIYGLSLSLSMYIYIYMCVTHTHTHTQLLYLLSMHIRVFMHELQAMLRMHVGLAFQLSLP